MGKATLLIGLMGGIVFMYSFFIPRPVLAACPLPGDVNCDGGVNIIDLSTLLSIFGSSNSSADFDNNGIVGLSDLSVLLSNFGKQGTNTTPTPTTVVASPTPTRTPTPTVTVPTPTTTAGDPSFACLNQAGPTQFVSGYYPTGKFEPVTANNKKFDARGAHFVIPWDISWQKITLRDATASNMCWAGGFVTSVIDPAKNNWHALDISWDQSKSGWDVSGTHRNTTAFDSWHDKTTWTGMYVYNVHDATRTSDSFNNWTIQHTWLNYARDDCIENDHSYSGTLYDVLFDGCYTGVSNQSGDGAGQLITMDKVLLRMEPMPYPYKWDEKSNPKLCVPGYHRPGVTPSDPSLCSDGVWKSSSSFIPFGNGGAFKGTESLFPQFAITNSVFLFEYDAEQIVFPPKDKVDACSNNTIIWLDRDPSTAPNYLLTDFPGCFTIITNKTQGRALWASKVQDWHARHPQVGTDHLSDTVNYFDGNYTWPRY